MLDTNVVIATMRRNHRVGERLRQCRPGEIGLSAIVLHELYFGAVHSRRVRANLDALDEIELPIVPFDVDDARVAGNVRAALILAGTVIGPYDILIAAQALSRGLTLVTRNTREFSRVQGLRFEDWEA